MALNYIIYDTSTLEIIKPITCYPNEGMARDRAQAGQDVISFDTDQVDLGWVKPNVVIKNVKDVGNPTFVGGTPLIADGVWFWDSTLKLFYQIYTNADSTTRKVYITDNQISVLTVEATDPDPLKQLLTVAGTYYVYIKVSKDASHIYTTRATDWKNKQVLVVEERKVDKDDFIAKNMYKIQRQQAYIAAGVTTEALAVALVEKIVENKPAAMDDLQAKRAAIKLQYPKPDGSADLVKPVAS